MQRILFINGCIRQERSRSLRLGRQFLEAYRLHHTEAEISTVDLTTQKLLPFDTASLMQRDIILGQWQEPMFSLARQFRQADMVVIAAPFWNGSFPACVHTYLEHVCVPGLTFDCENDRYIGLCNAKSCILITTRGGCYENGASMLGDELATPILKSVMTMLGIPEVITLAAEGLDLPSPGPVVPMEKAMTDAANLAAALP